MNKSQHFMFGGRCKIRLNVGFNAPRLSLDEALQKAKELNPELPVRATGKDNDIHIIDVERDAFYYNVADGLDMEHAAFLVARSGASIIDIDHANRRIITEGILNGV